MAAPVGAPRSRHHRAVNGCQARAQKRQRRKARFDIIRGQRPAYLHLRHMGFRLHASGCYSPLFAQSVGRPTCMDSHGSSTGIKVPSKIGHCGNDAAWAWQNCKSSTRKKSGRWNCKPPPPTCAALQGSSFAQQRDQSPE